MLLSLKHQTNKEYAITLDDGDEDSYQARLKSWAEKNYEARTGSSVPSSEEWNMLEEIYLPGNLPDEPIKNGFVVPGAIYADLFKYQRTCVMWLYELRLQKVGGIIGDEMGLGKTIQTIALLASLKRSRMLTRPVLVVCPATLMSQWVREIHDWFPPFRCIMLHTSGTGFSKHVRKKRKFRTISEMNSYRTQKLIQKVVDEGHILVTTYSGLQKNSKWLLPVKWGYVILDEGHKLKNPNAGITMTCKRLRTPHRIILTGTPIQNNLTELWSLFDFIYPGRLGTLPVFEAEFSVPINLGGYANASALEITCAYKSARALRSIIQPYMLRRMKAEVAQDLPKKSEQVLFCKITSVQRELYESFLKSKEVNSIIEGSLHPLFGIDVLRKICNHPCLYSFTSSKAFECSGKMIVLKEILKFWKSGNHKVLLFSQKRKVLNLLEELVKDMGYSYKRMDGMTPVKQRGQLVDKFNQNKDVFIFLLTTKVGGLGINLTGADRVVIFDPDWNPSTDMQARERAWRLGQLRPVIIYRLIVSGTIEEKIYQRQIFKTFLSNKVLKDPKQRRFFRLNDLKDLFSIGKESEKESRPETQGLFEEMRPKVDDDSLISELEGVKKLEPMEQTAPTPQNEGPEANMLDRLINKGMHSSLQHEDIIKNTNPEFVIMEQYAEKMLKSSLAALDASRSKLQSYSISAPTWTGHLGLAGKHSTTPSSSILLEKFKHPEGDEGSTRKTLGVEIRDFLDENQGKVKSSDLVRHFKSNLTKGYSTVFKKLLLEVADFQKEEDVGWWVLKNKYRR
ncbi:hypothetical protein HMI56_003720 [Coelomomyces lativittatus]|nr:hypothetical protein HMI56_003720 [Coelomomyces lativittatus]